MPNSNFTIGASVTGQQDLKDLSDRLASIHSQTIELNRASQQLGSGMSRAFGGVQSPVASIGQARQEYVNFVQEVDQQRRILQQQDQTFNQFYDNLVKSARAAGRAVTDYAAMRQELVALGNAADSATRSVSGISRANGMSFSAGTQILGGMATASAFSPNRNQVGFDQSNMDRFMVALTDAVSKSTANGMRVTMQEMGSSLLGLQQQQAGQGVQADIGANMGILTGFNRSGGLGVFGERGAGVLSSVNQSLAPGGGMNPLMQQYLSEKNPGADYWQIQYQAEEGIRSPQMFKDIMDRERARFGPNASQAQLGAMVAQDFGLSSAHVGSDLLNAMKNMGDIDPNDPMYGDISKMMGSGGNMEYLSLALRAKQGEFNTNGNFDRTKANAAFHDASGRDLITNNPNLTMEQFIHSLNIEGAPNGQANAARALEDSVQEQTNNYADLAQAQRDTIVSMQQFNAWVAGHTPTLGGANLSVPMAAVGFGQQALGAFSNVVMAGWGMSKIASVLRGAGAAKGAVTAAEGALPAAGETAGTAGGGMLAGMGGTLLGGLGLIAAGGYAAYQAHEQVGRDQQSEADRSEAEKEARYQAYKRDKAAGGWATVLQHPKYLYMDQAQISDIQQREARDRQNGSESATGQTGATSNGINAGGGVGNTPYGPAAPGVSDTLLGRIATATETTTTRLDSILNVTNSMLQIMQQSPATSTDANFQARYGIRTNGASGTTTLSIPTGGGSVGVSGATGGGYPTGGTGSGAGIAAIFGGTTPSVMQEFGVTDTSNGYLAAGNDVYTSYGPAFGMQGGGHPGVDYGVPRGTKVYSPVNGTVVYGGGTGFYKDTGSRDAPGNGELCIGIPDINGDWLILGHMSKITVSPGDKVTTGQLVGESGESDGPHVHVEYRRKNRPGDAPTSSGYTVIDPRQALTGPSTSAGSGAGISGGGIGNLSGVPADVTRWSGQTQQTFGDMGSFVPATMLALMQHESQGLPNAYNATGDAYGLFQQVGLGSFDPATEFAAARKLAQEKLASLQQSYKSNNMNPDAGTRARDLMLAWGGYFDYKTGQPDPNARDNWTGGDYQDFLKQIMPMYNAIVGGAGGNGTTLNNGPTMAMLSAMFGGGAAGGDGNAKVNPDGSVSAADGGTVAFEPLTVNVVYPDGTTVVSKLPLTTKDPFTGLRQYGTRSRA